MLRRLLAPIIDLVFPERSIGGKLGIVLSESEAIAMKMYPVSLQKILLRQRGLRSLDHVVAAGSYHSTPFLKDIIKALKYGGRKSFIPILASKLSAALPGLLPELIGIDAICPVPLHWTRKFSRGFNQAEGIAKELCIHRPWHVGHFLQRTRPTGHQAHRTREERLHALTNAFRYIGPSKPPKRVVLVDDIFTTGATLDACAAALKAAGVKRVDAIVVAHG